MISSTSCGSFVAYTANESPTSKLKPHPIRSSSKWRVSFSDSGPLRRRLTTRRAGKGFARVYRGATTAAVAVASAVIKRIKRLVYTSLCSPPNLASCHSERSGVEEWSERDERHGRLCREGSGERVGRRTSSIPYCYPPWCSTLRDVSTLLDMTKDDIARGRKFQPSFPIASVGQTSIAR